MPPAVTMPNGAVEKMAVTSTSFVVIIAGIWKKVSNGSISRFTQMTSHIARTVVKRIALIEMLSNNP
jgi:hypothetical protein